MLTESLSTLKIHKLTQAQYNRELDAGRLDENALYLTPEEEIHVPEYTSDLINDSEFATETYVNTTVSTQVTAALNNIVPEATSADEGKVLMAVNGVWKAVGLQIYVNDDGIISIVPIE